MQRKTSWLTLAMFVIGCLVLAAGTSMAAQDGGYNVTSELWAKAVLKTPGKDVTLIWSEVGSDTTPSGDKVISGYFYADPDDFAYGSQYNPELFVKIYIATGGWCNMAFNHVTVDDVVVSSAHNYNGAADQTGTAMLSSRLVEHTYTGVGTGTSSEDSVTGTWNGSWNSNYGTTGGITCKITQSGTSVSGTMTVTNTDCGTMSNVPFSGTEVYDGYYTFNTSTICQGSTVRMDFTGNQSENSLSGSYIQYVDGDWYDSGTYTLSR